ncbi:MAG TPA: hypothetical protein VHF45_04185 [Thermoleophilaceae bacterium]|nr:hypothetical protein [Thermoleophilaceae bacterium]
MIVARFGTEESLAAPSPGGRQVPVGPSAAALTFTLGTVIATGVG